MECADDTPSMGAESSSEAVATGKKVKLLSLSDLDGRTAAAKSARRLIEAIEADLGGSDRLTAAERVLAARAGMATVMIEDMEARWLQGRPLDPAAYATLANVVTRLLRTIGIQRRPRDVTPSLDAYLAERAAAEPTDAPDASPSPPADPVAPQLCATPADASPPLPPPPLPAIPGEAAQ